MVTSHDGRLLLSSLEILLCEFKVKFNADMLLLQLGKTSSKIKRPLQSARVICESTEIKGIDREKLL